MGPASLKTSPPLGVPFYEEKSTGPFAENVKIEKNAKKRC
jgi:hypothetical protein